MLKKLIFIITIFASIWMGGLVDFYGRIPPESPPEIAKADAIIVLTGGKKRIEAGVELLRANKAPKMFITGVGKDVGDLALLKRMDVAPQNAAKISLGHEAVDTFGNVAEAQKWIAENEVKSIILVTANYHMPRALGLFTKTMPDIEIHPYSVISPDFIRTEWPSNEKVRKIILSEYHKFLMSI
jgi:uncharacterized SAM-binding protein YcdF (DUF218 family)